MKKLTRKGVRFKGLTLGLDVHKKFIEYCVLDKDGEEVAGGKVASRHQDLNALLATLKKQGAVQACLEACGSFIWIFDVLAEALGRDAVHVAQPSRIHVIANSMEKNDANDAWWLAYLLYEQRLPEAFVAEGPLRELRIASRELRAYTDQRGDLLRRFKSHLAQAGLNVPKNWHASKIGRQKARAVLAGIGGERGRALQALRKQIARLGRQLLYWRARIAELAKAFKEIAVLQDQMPGFGLLLSSLALAELGLPQRFYNQKAYSKATGLTPGYRESGGHQQQTCITRHGSRHARWAFTRAVIACLRCKSGVGFQVRQWVEQRARHKPKKKVVVAAARKLAEGVWRLFAMGEVFDLAQAFPVKCAA